MDGHGRDGRLLTVGGTISEATGSNECNGFDLQSFLSLPRVLIFTSVIAVIDVVLATALATLGAFIYNLSAGLRRRRRADPRRGRVSPQAVRGPLISILGLAAGVR